ncbi:hypothetical protein [Cupriavidus basilensis]
MARIEELTLATLNQYCVADPQLVLPERDPLHVLTGPSHINTLFAPKQGFRMKDMTVNIRGGQPLLELSPDQKLADILASASPFVRELRCYCPLYYAAAQAPIVVHRVIAVELLIGPGQPHFHALVFDTERFESARAWLARRGVTCELFDRRAFSKVQIANADFCFGLVAHHDVYELREPAAKFARVLLESERRRRQRLGKCHEVKYRQCDLDGLMLRLGLRLKLGPSDELARNAAYVRFGAALALGYVHLEDGFELRVRQPLRLAI